MILGKLVFIHIPRCSGTSIEHSLLKGKMVPDGEKHWKASMLKEHLGDLWDGCFKFSIVRNPFDRLASLYITPEAPFCSYNMNAGKTMDEFLSLYKPMPWEHGITCDDYLDEVIDMTIRYEDRKEGILRVNSVISPEFNLRIDDTVVKRSHPNKTKCYMSYFTNISINTVLERFHWDFDRWYQND
jgi:hypothetical protein